MNFIIVDTKNKDHIIKIEEFSNNIEEKTDINNFMNELDDSQEKIHDNSIQEMIISTVGDKINNLCMIQGTKDNKLVTLTPVNYKDGNYEKNKKFIEYVTSYAINSLEAETVVVLRPEVDKSLEMAGYELIGDINNKVGYIKDREKSHTTGGVKK